MDKMITYSECECCEEVTVHIPVNLEDLTVEASDGTGSMHLTHAEAMALYWELKEVLLYSDIPVPMPVEE